MSLHFLHRFGLKHELVGWQSQQCLILVVSIVQGYPRRCKVEELNEGLCDTFPFDGILLEAANLFVII